MSAVTGPVASPWWVISDYFEMVKRSLRHIGGDPDQLVTVTLQPVTVTAETFISLNPFDEGITSSVSYAGAAAVEAAAADTGPMAARDIWLLSAARLSVMRLSPNKRRCCFQRRSSLRNRPANL